MRRVADNIFFLFMVLTFVSGCRSSAELEYVNNMTARISLECGDVLLIPMQDDAPEATVSVLDENNGYMRSYSARLAVDTTDYFIPYRAKDSEQLEFSGISFESSFSLEICRGKETDAYCNEHPVLHFRPLYGWINDPNGMVYKDGEWHLFYQYNPWGSKWGNLSWGHAVSEDLVHWEHMDVVLEPDSLGMIFSGSAVVDRCNSAGFGKDAIVAIYTSAGDRQTQSLAYSTDNGRSFVKYEGNPVLSSRHRDFRDPKVFRYQPEECWIMIISAGNAMEIYSSENLKTWRFESRFGDGAGRHDSVWECPDLFELSYNGESKWVLLCSSNRGVSGSAVQYFIGEFDGHSFIPDDYEERWLDYGRDFYAAVTWNNAPEDKKVAIAWESNWLYAADLPVTGYRGLMTSPRELFLMEYDGKTVVAAYPVTEVIEKCSKNILSFELIPEKPSFEINGVEFNMDFTTSILSAKRAEADFSQAYSTEDIVRLEPRSSHDILVIREDDSLECFIDSGAVCMTFLTL